MKKKVLFGFAAVVFAAVAIVACKRSFEKFDSQATNAGALADCDPVSCTQNVCNIATPTQTDTVPRIITGNFTLTNNKIWILPYKCYVDDGGQLNVNAGTIVKAIKRSSNDSAAAIIVTRGGKINAIGSSTCPIVFTSNESTPTTGDWGGIVLLGKANCNKVNPTIEGINLPSVPAGIDIHYGPVTAGVYDDEDNSGTLTYVRIEYAGAAIATDNELNGLTCGGVGRGTTIDFVQVYKGNDDAFEFFGGTVNAYHLYAYVPDDDAFDFDFGYSGTIQFAVSVLNATDDYSSNPNGIECDNDATGSGDQPFTRPIISNMTVVGVCDSATSKKAGDVLLNGAHFRRNTRYVVRNSVFMGFPTGVLLDWTNGSQTLRDSVEIKFNVIQAFDRPLYQTATSAAFALAASRGNKIFRTGTSANDSVKLVAPCNYACPDFRPTASSPAASGANFANWTVATDGDYLYDNTVTYRGAFATCSTPAANWLAGWTKH